MISRAAISLIASSWFSKVYIPVKRMCLEQTDKLLTTSLFHRLSCFSFIFARTSFCWRIFWWQNVYILTRIVHLVQLWVWKYLQFLLEIVDLLCLKSLWLKDFRKTILQKNEIAKYLTRVSFYNFKLFLQIHFFLTKKYFSIQSV